MTLSVVSETSAQATFCATIVDEWIRLGLTDVVLCPGSRSTPVALALARRRELNLHVRLDERSAGFVALGLARELKRPVGILVTSGTATSELHSAICEADLSAIPLIVITADRPPELHGVGAPQTMNQQHLFGTAVRSFIDPGVPVASAAPTWRALASRAFEAAAGVSDAPGPVQLNLPLRDPLDAEPSDLPPARPGSWRITHRGARPGVDLSSATMSVDRVLVVAGDGAPSGLAEHCAAQHFVLACDPRSGLRTRPRVVALADPILRSHAEALKPELVVLVGAPWASKVLGETIAEWARSGVRVVHLSSTPSLVDPHAVVGERVIADDEGLLVTIASLGKASSSAFVERWAAAEVAARSALDAALATTDSLSEPSIARLLGERRDVAVLTVSSSMPIRELEWFAPEVHAVVRSNRGVNGIDGVTSSAIGAALSGATTVCVIGDLAFLHDLSALVDGLGESPGSLVIVVVNNGGGGIFSFLPQASSVDEATFASLFHTARPINHELVVTGLGHRVQVVSNTGDFGSALDGSIGTPGISVVVANVSTPSGNVALHDRLNQAVASAISVAGI
jgi:2-succinyl-5-enolpyruvyl-6-hydroxy-3-cyclohexene-1-carboxylate synthase